MNHVVVEGLPAVGKSETLALLARFYPESVRVLPELVKEVVLRERIDLFRDRARLTAALAAELPRRRERVAEILDRGFLCLEESHLGVHLAYSQVLGDSGFVERWPPLAAELPRPDAVVRFELPIEASVARQKARGTPAFEIDQKRLAEMLGRLDQWHASQGTVLYRLGADRPPSAFLADFEALLGLPYGASIADIEETFDILLLLGRPASGKSEFIDFMTRLRPPERASRWHIGPFDVVDDFPILWEKFEEDDLWERLGHPRLHSKRADGNYAVTDPRLWGFLIERINQRVASLGTGRSPRTRIIEFSRGGASGYRDALGRLSPEILRRAVILYVDVSFEESWRRNLARYDEKRRSGILTHSVPREEMERTYGTDDWPDLASSRQGFVTVGGLQVPYATMPNEPESKDPAILGPRYLDALAPLYDAWRAAAR